MALIHEIGKGLVQGLQDAAQDQRGRVLVRNWGQLKTQVACEQIERAVARLISEQNNIMLVAILSEFGEQIKLADTYESQTEYNQLLWFFKIRFSESVEAAAPGPFNN